ncbi:MAG: dUTP diphosphatase [Lachnospira sp.]|nr:dUTP diphosphatase [Lachnospira sp.]
MILHTKVRFIKLDPEAVVPAYGTEYSAGADLVSLSDITIGPGETAFIHTGLALEIPSGLVGLVCARSGLASKHGIAPSNKVGVIDSDYRGEIMVSLHNHSSKPWHIAKGDRAAQLILMPYIEADFEESDTLAKTERGTGGFGSTGRS